MGYRHKGYLWETLFPSFLQVYHAFLCYFVGQGVLKEHCFLDVALIWKGSQGDLLTVHSLQSLSAPTTSSIRQARETAILLKSKHPVIDQIF